MSTSQFDRRTSTSPSPATFKFPDLSDETLQTTQEPIESNPASPMPQPLGLPPHLHSHERWQARRGSHAMNGWTPSGGTVGRHGRQKSLSEAIRTVRGRRASVSQNAHEIADALKAPVSARLIFLCAIWYTTSIMSNTSSKAILTALPKPVTLTLIQFMFVCSWCLLLSWAARIHAPLRNAVPVLRNGIRKPSREL
ncbi:TPT-domain-containing protein, partial [Aureobasidium melanogenum]